MRARLPAESFIYVADGGQAPYGDRPAKFVEARATEVARFLAARQARAMVIACNTASVLVAAGLRDRHTLPIVAMEPAIKPAALATRSKVVLVLATTSTIHSAPVARLCRAHGKGIRIILQACRGLADAVERAEIDCAPTRQLLRQYILPGIAEGADTIVLGCTHYAFLAREISAIAGPSVTVVEPSAAIAAQLARVLPAAPSASGPGTRATSFYTSGPPALLSSFLAAVGEPFEKVLALPAAGARGLSRGGATPATLLQFNERAHAAIERQQDSAQHVVDAGASHPGRPAGVVLARSNVDATQPAFLSWLGVTMYLTREVNLASLRSIAASAAVGSELVFTYVDQAAFEGNELTRTAIGRSVASIGEPFLSGFDPRTLSADLRDVGFDLRRTWTTPRLSRGTTPAA